MSSAWQQLISLDLQRPFVFLVGSAALMCLTAIWAGTSERHWFWRGLAVWVAFALMIPVRAWEPAWMFGFCAPVIIATIVCGNWLLGPRNVEGARSKAWRFTLRDLFALMLMIALWIVAILKVARSFEMRNWLGWFTCSAAMALVAILAYARARTQRWPMKAVDWLQLLAEFWLGLVLISQFQRSAIVFLTTYLVVAAITLGTNPIRRSNWSQTVTALLLLGVISPVGQAIFSAGYWMGNEGPIRSSAHTLPEKIGMIDLFALELAWALIVALLLARAWQSADVAVPWRGRAGVLVRAILCVWAALVCWTYWQLLTIRPVPAVPAFTAPTNHFARIMAIAERAIILSPKNESITSLRRTTPKAAEELEGLCQELMQLLDAPNYVPYDPAQPSDLGWLHNHWHAAQMLPHVLERESIACSDNKNPDVAADYALAIIRLGDLQCRGALSDDFGIGTTMRRYGLRQLVALRDELSPEATRKMIDALQRSIDGREDPEVGWARRLWYRQNFWDGWALNLERIMDERQERDEFETQTMVRERRQELGKRLLQADLAVRLFQHDHGRLPAGPSELVPEYLPAVPVDFNSRPLEMKIVSDGFVIHCIGWGGLEVRGPFSRWAMNSQQEEFGIDLDYLMQQQF